MADLLNIDKNHKTVKGRKLGYATAVLYLAPHRLSGNNVCASASDGCIASCLNTAGRGAMSMVQTARIKRTQRFFLDRTLFMAQLMKELFAFEVSARKNNLVPVVRLNGTSDIMWENVPVLTATDHLYMGKMGTQAMRRCEYRLWNEGGTTENIFRMFPTMQFYDYTKHHARMMKSLSGDDGHWPKNYHLTYSLSEKPTSDFEAAETLRNGGNVAAVFSAGIPNFVRFSDGVLWADPLANERTGFPVMDGDENDLRFLQGFDMTTPNGTSIGLRSGYIVGLRAKGNAKYDRTGFVRSSLPDHHYGPRLSNVGLSGHTEMDPASSSVQSYGG